ncbi:MAG TPA: S8/S53 family peptidase [Puia sp.]|nr:S8/S53 family peptidase [Puia sp.]
MIVTVTDKFLNVRVGLPSLNAPCNQFLAPGTDIEVDGQLYKGDLFKGVDTWMKDSAGNYYWSGGVLVFQPWFTGLHIPEIWQFATGKGVGVAIVDTGIKNDLPELPLSLPDFVYDNSRDTTDTDGHGTFCAGLVGLKRPLNNAMGVAPGAKIFASKIAETSAFGNAEKDANRYADAIDWCALQKDIHVISISWGNPLGSDTTIKNIQRAIDNAVKKGKIIVCAIGDAAVFNDNAEYFPAAADKTIGVGSIPIEHKLYPYINPHLSVILNGGGIDSVKIAGFDHADYGTSWSNAIMAGIIALIIEKLNFKYDLATIGKIIQDMVPKKTYSIGDVTLELPTLDGDKLLSFFKT